MKTRICIVVLVAFTVFITWRAKVLERSLFGHGTVSLVDKPAPEFQLTSLDGRKVALADYRGKKNLVVSFWASWCGPCRLELPALRSFYQRHHKDSEDFEILAISIDDDPAAANVFATQAKLPFPVMVDSSHQAADAYDVESIPVMFVIDKTGKVVDGYVGFDAAMEFKLMRELGLQDKKNGAEDVKGDAKQDNAAAGGKPDGQ